MGLRIGIYAGVIPSTKFVENLIDGLANEGIEVYLFGKQYEEKLYPPNVHRFPTPKSSLLLPFFTLKEWMVLGIKTPGKAKALFQYLKLTSSNFRAFVNQSAKYLPFLNHPPDVLHIQWVKMAPSLLPIKLFMNNCWIVSFRGAHINYSPIADPALAASYQETFPQIEGFHAVSQAIVQEGGKYGSALEKTRVIKPAVKKELLNEFDKDKPRSNSKLQLISIGRFHWKKGYHYALDALKIIKKQGVDFHYTIVAKGDQEEILYQIHDLGLQNKVTIIPGLFHEEVIQKLKDSDLFLLPSVEEGIANVVLEAMAGGVPVISTDCGGMEEVIQSGENGWLVPIRNAEKLAEAIKHFTTLDQDQIQSIRLNAYQTIRDHHLLEHQIEGMKHFYEGVIEK